jgi:hypothetical protein
MIRRMRMLWAALLVVGLAASAQATVIYDEGVDGALSTDPNNPTQIAAITGDNDIVISVGGGDSPNYFELDLAGRTLTSVILVSFSTPPSNNNTLLVNCDLDPCNPFNGNGRMFMDDASVGADLLLDLSPGYVLSQIWALVESSSAVTTATLRFQTVPEPATFGLLAVGLAGAAVVRRRRGSD